MSSDANMEGVGKSLGRILLLLGFVLLVVTSIVPLPNLIRSLVVIFASAVTVVYVSMPFIMRVATAMGAIDHPGGRRIHDIPTPRFGGIAVYAGVIVALCLTSMHYMPNLKALLVGGSLVLVVGVLDDIAAVRPSVKLFGQLAACAILVGDGVCVSFLPATWWGIAGEWLITVVWIVGITNAVNFLDGMDGLVAGLVCGTSVIYFTLSILLGSNMLAYCSVALFAASAAFLSHNIKPARIFLGDGGSNFLGFFLAALSIHGTWAKRDPLVSFFIPILILSVPIYDMVFTTVARIASGDVTSLRSWLEFTGRDHIHHRLEQLGLTRGWVVVTICFLNMAVGLGAITLFEARTYGGVALIAQGVCVYVILALLEVLGARGRDS